MVQKLVPFQLNQPRSNVGDRTDHHRNRLALERGQPMNCTDVTPTKARTRRGQFCMRLAFPVASSGPKGRKLAHGELLRIVGTALALILITLLSIPGILAGQGLDTAKIDQVLGRSGQKIGEVYKFGFPRTDLHVTLQGVAIKPGLALGAWAAFSGSEDSATVMGDLVLLQSELEPVMEKLRRSGFEVTGVHNHLLNESPRVMYMHYVGHGMGVELAQSLKAALAVSKTPLGKPLAPAGKPAEPAFVKTVEEVLGRKGNVSGGVLAYGIPRADEIKMDGMSIRPAMGVAEAINFQEAGTGKVATTGDFVLTADEVNPVIDALHEHHIEVTALHSHMLYEEPRLFFMHFWGLGDPKSVAEGIKAALDKVRTK